MHRTGFTLCLVLSIVFFVAGCAARNETALDPVVAPKTDTVVTQPDGIENVIDDQSSTDGSAVAPSAAAEERKIDVSALDIVFFDYDSYDLSTEAKQLLESHAQWLRTHRDVKATIEGHCDERGSDEYNLALGERRARAAKDYLARQGVAPERLTILSFGEERPSVNGHDELAWEKNRRVEFR